MKTIKILSVLCVLILTFSFCAFPSLAATGDHLPGGNGTQNGTDSNTGAGDIIGDEGAASTENGNSVGTKETGNDANGTAGDANGMAGDVNGTDTGMGDGTSDLMPDENISENDDGSIESGDTVEDNSSDTAEGGVVDDATDKMEDGKTSSWLGILITIIIVVAVACLIIAFIPKKRS